MCLLNFPYFWGCLDVLPQAEVLTHVHCLNLQLLCLIPSSLVPTCVCAKFPMLLMVSGCSAPSSFFLMSITWTCSCSASFHLPWFLYLISDWQEVWKPLGYGSGVCMGKGRGQLFRLLANPYPGCRFAGRQGFWLGVSSLCKGNFKLSFIACRWSRLCLSNFLFNLPLM